MHVWWHNRLCKVLQSCGFRHLLISFLLIVSEQFVIAGNRAVDPVINSYIQT